MTIKSFSSRVFELVVQPKEKEAIVATEVKKADPKDYRRAPFGSPEFVYLNGLLRKQHKQKPNKRLHVVKGVTTKIIHKPLEAFAIAEKIVKERSMYLVAVQELRDGNFETEKELSEFHLALSIVSHENPMLDAVKLPRREFDDLYNNAARKFAWSEDGVSHQFMMFSIDFSEPPQTSVAAQTPCTM